MPKLTLILVVGIFVGLVFVLAVQVLTHCWKSLACLWCA